MSRRHPQPQPVPAYHTPESIAHMPYDQLMKDHVWQEVLTDSKPSEGTRCPPRQFKCILCGAVTTSPPPAPTPAEWLPEQVLQGRGYEPLNEMDRALQAEMKTS